MSNPQYRQFTFQQVTERGGGKKPMFAFFLSGEVCLRFFYKHISLLRSLRVTGAERSEAPQTNDRREFVSNGQCNGVPNMLGKRTLTHKYIILLSRIIYYDIRLDRIHMRGSLRGFKKRKTVFCDERV